MMWSEISVELTLQILTFFDPAELVNFRGVNSFFKALVDETTTFQYRIALFASGMSDGHPGGLTISERLELLRKYEACWKNIEWSEHNTIFHLKGTAYQWGLYGNVWAHSSGRNAIECVQLPSRLHGIPMRQWKLRFDFDIREFGMDPSQDLLVIFENTFRNFPNLCRIRLRTLSTGEKHPLAESTAAIEYTLERGLEHEMGIHSMKICGNYVGILVRNSGQGGNELVVWNWKTGVGNLMVLSTNLKSFVFLNDNLILGSSCQWEPPALLVYRLEQRPADDTTPTRTYFLRFLLGPRSLGSRDNSYILLASDPSPGWLPSAGRVPFHRTGDERMVAMYTQIFDDSADDLTEMALIPAKALIKQIESLPREGIDVEWEVHGPQHILHIPEHKGWDYSWPYVVFGMRYVLPEVVHLDGKPNILIRDLSPRRCLRASKEEREESGELFKAIRTCPPGSHGMSYPRSILKCVPLPENLGSWWSTTFLISEDGIVFHDNESDDGVLHLLTL